MTSTAAVGMTNEQTDLEHQGGQAQEGTNVDRRKRLFLINRALIVLAVAAILAGLLFDQWRIVLRNAVLL
jgi:hypothetical protein